MIVFSQIVLNSIIRGSQLGLLAIGITMIFAILKFANIAHGEFAVVGAYLAYFFSVTLKFNLLIAGILTVGFTGLIGVCADQLIFARLRKAPGIVLLVASMGLSMVMRDTVSAIWGPDPKSYDINLEKIYTFGEARITSSQLLILLVTAISMFSFHFLLHNTKVGKAMRAISDNSSLAQASGIHVEKIIKWVWFISAAFAGLGGILIARETLLWPYLGFQILLPLFCAAILGGIGNIYGAFLGAMILSFAENILLFFDWSKVINFGGVFYFDRSLYIPTGYKLAISFIILIIVLIFRPMGILRGQKGD